MGRYDAFIEVPEKQRGKWCYNNYLNYRSMSSCVSVRRQLEGILRKMRIDVNNGYDLQNVNYFNNIKKCLLSGFFMQVAHRERTGHYLTIKDNQVVKVYPSSVLKNKPDWVMYHEFVLTTANYMRTITAIDGEWLMEVKNEAEALEVVNYRKRRRERQSAIQKKQGDASEVEAEEEEKDVVHIPLVLKADVDGSIQVGVGTVSNGAGADAGDQHSQPLHSQRAVPRGGVGYGSGQSGRHRDGARLQGHPCDLQHQNTELLRDLCLTRRSSPEGREVDARIHRLRHHHLLAVRHGACWVGE